MDYIRSQINRIADELRIVGVSVPGGPPPPPPPAMEVPQETDVTVSASYKSSIYLPRWLDKHRNDPALMVILSLR